LKRCFYSLDADGVRLAVRVTPRARHSEIVGRIHVGGSQGALAVKLAAPPVEGAANEALIGLLAKELGVSRSALRIVAGEKSRLKTVRIADCPLQAIAAWAAQWPD
jgi:uncharacterized protein